MSNVIAVIANNVNEDKAVAKALRYGLIECASHWFNLAVTDLVVGYKALVTKFHFAATNLRALKVTAKKTEYTPFKAILNITTRGNSCFPFQTKSKESGNSHLKAWNT